MDTRDSGLDGVAGAQVGRMVPGLSVVVADTDDVRLARAFGAADIGSATPMTPDSICNWFSMTKLVTATAAVQLADRGRLDLDTPVCALYEPLSMLHPVERARRVTTRHLLSHSAGLANPLPLRWVHLAGLPGPERGRFVEGLLGRHRRLRFDPGARPSYTNLGYLVVGEVIAQAAGETFEQYVSRNVLDPLGMTSTGFAVTDGNRWATPYQRWFTVLGALTPLLVPRALLGPKLGRFRAFHHFYLDGAAYGGLVGPATDAARFLRAHLRDGELDGTRVLSADAARSMRTIVVRGRHLEVGLGWFRRGKVDSRDFVEHLGGGAGFWNCLRVYPGAGAGAVVMGNATSYDHDAIIEAARHER
jgi:CubicO group peptidase (beta-lactamase class C family)